jgi:Rad51 protein
VTETFVIEPPLVPDAAESFEPFAPVEPFGPGAPRPPCPVSPAPVRFAPRPRRARAAPLLPSEPALFSWLARRFSPGEATVWTGATAAVEPVLESLYVGSALAHGRVSLLEGGNRFRPYHLGELGRAFGLDAAEPLERIRLARAFTAYQTVALVDGWAREARRHRPTLLVGHDLPTLFAADEIPDDEREALLRHVARTLRALLDRWSVPLLLTLGPDGLGRFPGLADEGPRWCDLVAFERGPGTLRARSMRDGARLALVPRAPGQRGIEEFGDPGAEEVIAWDVPPRRTVRRSRNG